MGGEERFCNSGLDGWDVDGDGNGGYWNSIIALVLFTLCT